MSSTFRDHDLVFILAEGVGEASVILRGEATPLTLETVVEVSVDRREDKVRYCTDPLSKEHSLLLPKEFLS